MGVIWRLLDGKEEKITERRRGRIVAWRCRLKREDCRLTNYDSAFSKWQILIGPDDWANYSLGKEGAERYRTSNLSPSCSRPGIYELGVAKLSSSSSRRFDPKEIIAVYIGQAENVRTRLQHYGRTGSHLERNDSSVLHGKKTGLFREVFSLGFSIMFRWAPMGSKREAIDAEADLLRAFDYAWNRISNSGNRSEDILPKLEERSRSSFSSFLSKIKPWKWKWKFSPRKVQDNLKPIEKNQLAKSICGVITDDGSLCLRNPNPGRKRCGEHKGRRVNVKKGNFKEKESSSTLCGVLMEDGSICSIHPPMGRKRCHLHKGRRIGIISLKMT